MRIPKTIRDLVLLEAQDDPALPWDPYAAHQSLPRNQQPQRPIPAPETYRQRAARIGSPSPAKPWTGVQPQAPAQDPSFAQSAWQTMNTPIEDFAKKFVDYARTAPQQAWEMLKRLNTTLSPSEFEQLKAVIKKHNI